MLVRAALVLVAVLAACSTSGPTVRLAENASVPVVPLAKFFASGEANWGYRVSPDGTRVAWIGQQGRATIFSRPLAATEARVVNTGTRRSVTSFTWARDSRRLLFLRDDDGDENHHVYVVSTETPDAPPVDLTPWGKTVSWVHRAPRSDPDHVVIASNRRRKDVFDLYRVNLATAEATMIAENPGDVEQWATDWDGRPRARIVVVSPTERSLEVFRDRGWRAMQRLDLEEFDLRVLGPTADDRGLWLLTGRGRDRAAVARLDVATGVETVVHERADVDVDWVTMSELHRAPLIAWSHPGYPDPYVFDRRLRQALATLQAGVRSGLRLMSSDDAGGRYTVERYTDKGYESFLVDVDGGAPVRLGSSHTLAFADALGSTEPVELTARDGVRLHGYLTRPPGGGPGPWPLVLHVHGGHWARDYWGYDRVVQFLANRGYAVLQVNYRGSTGYGRAFRELAIGEYGGKMHDDLVDAVRWAVSRRLADPARVAIYGASYGGYAALVGMTFTPEVFACGVSVVGMSNLVTLFETTPAYWRLTWVPRFVKYMGDPSNADDRRRLEERSPLFRAASVQRPILVIHGARDERVKVAESEQMVAALRTAGKDVRYVVFPDEGHRRDYGNWRNALRHYSEVEEFFARCLGGRVTTPLTFHAPSSDTISYTASTPEPSRPRMRSSR